MYPTEVVGKRVRYRVDASKVLKVRSLLDVRRECGVLRDEGQGVHSDRSSRGPGLQHLGTSACDVAWMPQTFSTHMQLFDKPCAKQSAVIRTLFRRSRVFASSMKPISELLGCQV